MPQCPEFKNNIMFIVIITVIISITSIITISIIHVTVIIINMAYYIVYYP